VFAGKAHPSDEEAKRILQSVFRARWAGGDGDRAVFLEDYGIGMARQLVWGCDVWINLPRPPLEASGTSGMKSAFNGGLNLSVLDGWWAEAYDGSNGWAIEGAPSDDVATQDDNDARAMYDLLEHEVVPLFYDRDPDGLPKGWVDRIKRSLRTNGPRFCATRMVHEYREQVERLG
jgi:starch phosphorylase